MVFGEGCWSIGYSLCCIGTGTWYENMTILENVRYEYINKIISFVIEYNMKELNSSIHNKKITLEV